MSIAILKVKPRLTQQQFSPDGLRIYSVIHESAVGVTQTKLQFCVLFESQVRLLRPQQYLNSGAGLAERRVCSLQSTVHLTPPSIGSLNYQQLQLNAWAPHGGLPHIMRMRKNARVFFFPKLFTSGYAFRNQLKITSRSLYLPSFCFQLNGKPVFSCSEAPLNPPHSKTLIAEILFTAGRTWK